MRAEWPWRFLKRNYSSRVAAQTEMPEAFREYYRKNYFSVYNTQRAQIERGGRRRSGIYNGQHLPG